MNPFAICPVRSSVFDAFAMIFSVVVSCVVGRVHGHDQFLKYSTPQMKERSAVRCVVVDTLVLMASRLTHSSGLSPKAWNFPPWYGPPSRVAPRSGP